MKDWDCYNCGKEIDLANKEGGEIRFHFWRQYEWSNNFEEILCEECLDELRSQNLEDIVAKILN